MTTSDILLKLLPFTHKQDNTVAFTINLDLGDWIVTSIELALFFIFFGTIIKLYLSYRKDYKDILFLEKEVINLKNNGFNYYNSFLENIASNNRITHVWNEFHESLIRKGDKLENSLDADYFFNERTLASHVGTKFYSAIAGILLGIGLLGTFFALYVALIELNLDGNDLKNSIKTFIGMVGVKFTASVWGILLSVLYTFIEKALEGKLSNKIHNLQDMIDDIFKRQTAEQNLFIIANEAEQQTRALNTLAETLTQKISDQFNPIISQMNSHLQQMPMHISDAIGESLKEPLSVLSQNAKSAVESQSDNLGKLVETFIQKIEHAAGQQTEGIQSLMINTTEGLTQLINNLNQTNQQMLLQQQKQDERVSQAIEKMQDIFDTATSQAANNMNEIYAKQQDTMQHQHKMITEESNQITNKMQVLLENLTQQNISQNESVEKITHNFENIQKELFESNKTFLQEVEDKNNRIIESMIQKMAQVEAIIDNSSQKLAVLPNLLQTFETGSQNLQLFAQTTKEATEEFNEAIVKTNALQTSLSIQIDKANEIMNNLSNTSESTLQVADKVKNSVDEIHNIYTQVIEENQHNLEKFSEAMSEWLKAYDEQTHATMQNSLNEVQAALANFANTLSQSIASLEDAIESINEKLEK